MANGDRSAGDLELRAARAGAATTTGADRERHLDALLPPHGFHCLHDCRWPGTPDRIDHVVIGPTGVWVVEDARLTGSITADGAGDLWSGRFPLAPELARALEQARAVDAAIGSDGARTILSISGVTVPGGVLTRDRMVVASALDATSSVIMRGHAHLKHYEVERLAAAARVVLAPNRTAAPGSMLPPTAPTAPKAEVVPPWMTARTVEPLHISHRRVVRRAATSRWLRVIALIALAWIAVGVVAAAYKAVSDDIATDRVPAASPLAGAPISVEFECRNPMRGWTAVASWPRLGSVSTVSWSPNLEGPWVDAATFGSSAARDGIPPGDRVLVRVADTTAAGRAPAASC